MVFRAKLKFFKWNHIGTMVPFISTINKEFIHIKMFDKYKQNDSQKKIRKYNFILITLLYIRWLWNTKNEHKTLQVLFKMLPINVNTLLNSHSCFSKNVGQLLGRYTINCAPYS